MDAVVQNVPSSLRKLMDEDTELLDEQGEATVRMMEVLDWSGARVNLKSKPTTKEDWRRGYLEEIAFSFEALVEDCQYDQAATMVTEDFVWSAPMFSSKGKDLWIRRFPIAHKLHPKQIVWGTCEILKSHCGEDLCLSRRGKWKVAPFLTVTVQQSVTIDATSGKIKSMVASVVR